MIVDATGVPYSCGDFDSAIEHIEEGRTANDALRGVAVTALEQVAEMEDTIHDLKKQISDLQNQVEELENEAFNH